MRITIPEKAKYIIDVLEDAGYEAYVVGGCVRDSILGREPQDWDITTSALPLRVKELFRRTIDTGLQHGTVTVMQGEEGFEVTTYRIDGEYEDGRHPKDVTFTPNLEEDLLRRDFTINAMAYNDRRGLVDLYDGIGDIERKIIRCVGDPNARFSEDALRMLRAVRFSAQLGYTIEPATREAITKLAPTLEKISAERIRTELVKLLVSNNPYELKEAYETGMTAVFLPEFDRAMQTEQNHKHHCYSVGEHILHAIEEVEATQVLRMAMLLHDIGKPDTLTVDESGITHFHGHVQKSEEMAKVILRRLKFDNDSIDKICRLVRFHDYGMGIVPDEKIVRRAVNKIGEDIFSMFLQVGRADIMAQSDYERESKLANNDSWGKMYDKIMEENQCVSLKTLKINGRTLIEMGVKPGPELGRILNTLLEEVLDNPSGNDEEWLKNRAQEIK
ncbi:MAG: CCA tRNA nucleotidyltransferase [Lachnospiraceae bacterium]|nr:CCA tRNA nucleotidyltransferase [Lachnospiraceae bacterium]